MKDDMNIIDILLVEDNPDDIEIAKRALKEAHIINKLWIVRDGEEALDFLFHTGQYLNKSVIFHPGLILLDINLPKINGIEVLRRIKEDNTLKRIPIIMLTVSKRDEDIVKSYDYGCNSFLQKPVEFERFVELVKQIGLYWGVLNITS